MLLSNYQERKFLNFKGYFDVKDHNVISDDTRYNTSGKSTIIAHLSLLAAQEQNVLTVTRPLSPSIIFVYTRNGLDSQQKECWNTQERI